MGFSQVKIDEIKKLSVSEKILIVEEIWDNIMKNDEYPKLTKAQQIELNKRIDYNHANPQEGKTWDEIKKKFWQSK